MNTIKIGTNQHNFCDVTASWIQQHVGQRRDEGQNVCVVVTFNTGLLNFSLSTPGCTRGGGGNWQPNENEAKIIELWKKLHLDDPHWAAGNLTAFVKQAQHLVC